MKQFSGACERNRQPILSALLHLLPPQGRALEIASGTGQHIAHFAQHLPGWQWQPSDMASDGFESIQAWCSEAGVSNVLQPALLEVMAASWPSAPAQLHLTLENDFGKNFDLIFCANMLHIAPWTACAGLMQGASRHLTEHGVLITYGPYLERDLPVSPGNLAFDQSLRERNAAWGIRPLEDVVAQARVAGLEMKERIEMPANNLMLVFKRN